MSNNTFNPGNWGTEDSVYFVNDFVEMRRARKLVFDVDEVAEDEGWHLYTELGDATNFVKKHDGIVFHAEISGDMLEGTVMKAFFSKEDGVTYIWWA